MSWISKVKSTYSKLNRKYVEFEKKREQNLDKKIIKEEKKAKLNAKKEKYRKLKDKNRGGGFNCGGINSDTKHLFD